MSPTSCLRAASRASERSASGSPSVRHARGSSGSSSRRACCSLLLIVSGVLLRGAPDATSIDPGIRTRDVLQIAISDSDRAATLDRLRGQPGLRAIGASSQTVLDGIYPVVMVKPAGSGML